MSDLSFFIREALKRGYSEQELFPELLRKGYSKKEIENAFVSLSKSKNNRNTSQEKIGPFKKLELLFSQPGNFFTLVKENSVKDSLILFTAVALVIVLLNIGISFLLKGFFFPSGGIFRYTDAFFIVPYIFSFIALFVFSIVTHGIARLFGGRGNYTDSLNAIAYSAIPTIIFTIILPLALIAFIYSVILLVFGISEYHQIEKGKAVIAAIVPILAVILFLGIIIMFFIYSFRF